MPSAIAVRSFLARFLIALVAGFVLLSAMLWGEDTYAAHTIDGMRQVHFSQGVLQDRGAKDADGKPANYLIVGSDSRAFVTDPVDKLHFGDPSSQSGNRSDTIMIAHIDPNAHEAFLVSLPRDTGVTIPGGCHEKINAAFNSDYKCAGQHGGPDMLVETIKENFDVDINHYLEVDFVGFRNVIDVLGTVDIYFPAKARDAFTGLDVDGGCQHLDGLMALNYARSRHYQYFDYQQNRWREDPTSDFGRIRRQQYLIRTLLQASVNQGVGNPLTANALISKMVKNIGRDSEFNVGDVRRLLNSFSVTSPASVPMLTLPVTSGRNGNLALLQPDAEALLQRLRTFAPPPPTTTTTVPAIKTSQVRVFVRNGMGVNKAAATANRALSRLGFQTTTVDSVAKIARTEVRYTSANAGKAFLVAKYLGGVGKFVIDTTLPAGDVVVVLGADWKGVVDPATTKTTTPRTTTTTAPNAKDAPKPNPGSPPAGTNPKTIGAQFIGCRR